MKHLMGGDGGERITCHVRDGREGGKGYPMMNGVSENNREGRVWTAISIIALAAYVGLAIACAVITPWGEAPDEEAHLLYVKAVAQGDLPLPGQVCAVRTVQRGGRSETVYVSSVAHHPPLYYGIVASLYLLCGRNDAVIYVAGRALSILFGLAAILLVRAAALRTFPARPEAAAGATVIPAASATFCYVTSSLNNEALAVLIVCLSVYVAVCALSGRRPMRDATLLGVVLGLALLTKMTAAVAIVPLLVVAWFVAHHDSAGNRVTRAVARLAVGLAIALIIAAPWFAHNFLTVGKLSYNCAFRPVYRSLLEAAMIPKAGFIVLSGMAEELLVAIVWPNWLVLSYVPRLLPTLSGATKICSWTYGLAPWPLILFPLLLVVVTVVGVDALLRGPRSGDPPLSDRERAVTAILLLLIGAELAGIVHEALLVDVQIWRWAPRYMPVVTPSIGVLVGLAAGRLTPRRARGPVVVGLLAAGLALSIAGVMAIARFYA